MKKFLLILLIFLLVYAAALSYDYVPPETAPASPPETPADTASPAPLPTETREPDPTPGPATDIPQPTPTPTPTYGDSLGSGSFKSDTGLPINLKADWSVKTVSASQVEVTIKVSVDSYAIHLQAVPYAVKLNVNGEYVSMDAPAVDYDGNAATNTVFGSKTFTVNLSSGSSANIPVAVEWHFGGTYGGEQVDVIECGGTISVSR